MKKIKLGIALLLLAALFVTVHLQAQAEKTPKAAEAEKRATAIEVKQQPKPQQLPRQVRPPEVGTPADPGFFPEFSTNDFILLTGVVDEFGRPCESDSFKVQISSGGHPTNPRQSWSSNYGVRHGYAETAADLHGDANGDGRIDGGDIVYLQNYLFFGGPPPRCILEAGDANCNGFLEAGDMVYLIAYLYRGGPPPCDPPA